MHHVCQRTQAVFPLSDCFFYYYNLRKNYLGSVRYARQIVFHCDLGDWVILEKKLTGS